MDADQPKKKRKGGLQQRLAEIQNEENMRNSNLPGSNTPSLLAKHLEEGWAWGRYSPQEVQHLAVLAVRDMAVPGDLAALAKLGTYGAHSNNVHRDLMQVVKNKSLLPEPIMVQMPFKGKPFGLQAIMVPHLVFHFCGRITEPFGKPFSYLVGKMDCNNFGKHFQVTLQWKDLLPKQDGKNGWYLWTFMVMQCPQLAVAKFGQRWCKDTVGLRCSREEAPNSEVFFIWGVYEQILQHGPGGTLEIFFGVLQWSFACLQTGKFPSHDWFGKKSPAGSWEASMAGQDLAGGFCGHLASIQGDLDFFASALQLPRWSVKAGGCCNCQCTFSGATTWQKFNDVLHIANLEWKVSNWRLWEQRSPCKLFDIPFVTAMNVMLDYLHLKYLGTDMYQYGAIFWLLVYRILPGTPVANLESCWQKKKYWYAKLGTKNRYHYFNRLTMFVRKSGPPKLRGRGAEVQGLCQVILEMWKEWHNPALEMHRMILQMLKQNVAMEDILQEHKGLAALPADAANDFTVACFKMAHLNHLIAEHFKNEDDVPALFQVTIKLHMLLHVALHSHEISPRLSWNFTGEDEMGVLKIFGQNCAKGLQAEDVGNKMLLHWRHAMHLEMSKIWKKRGLLCMCCAKCF